VGNARAMTFNSGRELAGALPTRSIDSICGTARAKSLRLIAQLESPRQAILPALRRCDLRWAKNVPARTGDVRAGLSDRCRVDGGRSIDRIWATSFLACRARGYWSRQTLVSRPGRRVQCFLKMLTRCDP
jgi:hypothetical protein